MPRCGTGPTPLSGCVIVCWFYMAVHYVSCPVPGSCSTRWGIAFQSSEQILRPRRSMAVADLRHSGRVLGPAEAGSDWWDRMQFSGAVVVERPGQGFGMYYYGRSGPLWNQGVEPFNPSLPTGRIGLALSSDGRAFQRFLGPLPGGAVLDPAADPAAFDSVHVGVSDVISEGDSWLMFYFGAGMEEAPLMGSNPPRLARGIKLRPGTASSRDGITWDRSSNRPLMELGAPGDWDQNGVSWPRVLPPGPDGRWLMTYHTREAGGLKGIGFFSAGVATSTDGRQWEKHGKVLSVGEPGSWDEGGVSVRHVVPIDGRYVMFYEGSDFKFNFAVGVATSQDGIVWEKDLEAGPEPGGPVLIARKGENVWDNVIVGTPYVIKRQDGSLWMYYLGLGKLEGEDSMKHGIGLAVSHCRNFRSWKRFDE